MLHDDAPRSSDANRKFHAMLRDISKQVKWAGALMDEETWKRVMLAAKFGQKVIANPLDGITPIVVNARRSRTLSKDEMTEFIAEIEAFGVEQGVEWEHDED